MGSGRAHEQALGLGWGEAMLSVSRQVPGRRPPAACETAISLPSYPFSFACSLTSSKIGPEAESCWTAISILRN